MHLYAIKNNAANELKNFIMTCIQKVDDNKFRINFQ